MESGIEVVEEGKRTRVLMPVLAPRLRLGAERWMGRVEAWCGVLLIAGGLWVCGDRIARFAGKVARNGALQGPWDWAVAGVGLLVVMLFVGQMLLGTGLFWRMFFRSRVEVVIDRRGVAQRGWGPVDMWRVRLNGIRGVRVCAPSERRAGKMKRGDLASVQIGGQRGARTIRGAYAPEAALILKQQIEKVRNLEGVVGEAVVVRDDVGVGPGERRAEQVVESCGVRVERTSDGAQVEMGVWKKEMGPREDEAFLVLPEGRIWPVLGVWFGGVGIGMAVLGVSGEGSAMGKVGILIATAATFMGMGWLLVATMATRVTYDVGPGGITRRTRVFRMEWRKEWGRQEIEVVYLRKLRWRGGWGVGIRKRSGKQVDLAMGWRWMAEAFAEILERELGMGEVVGGERLRGGSG